MKRKLIQYDISRGRIPDVETICKQVHLLKKYGLDGALLYMECVVENKTFPACRCGSTPVTKEYLSNLNRYMNEENLELVPLLQILGHQSHLLAMPGMSKHGEFEEKSNSFRLDCLETKEAIKDWLTEIIPFFNSKYVHVGGDEASDIGLGKSRELTSEKGYEKILADYFNEIAEHLRSHGKKMVLYADSIIHYPQLRELLDKSITICNWGYCNWTDIYEQENHNFAMHEYVTAKHDNWCCGNNMAEYIITPFQRLEENTSIWMELGGKSNAEYFIIGDWGSRENVNPFSLSQLGSIYILERLRKENFSLEELLNEISQLVFGENNGLFTQALQIMITAQGNSEYWGSRLKGLGPIFPTLLYNDPDSKEMIRTCACLNEDGIKKFEKNAEKAYELMHSISNNKCLLPTWLDEFKALSRRMVLIALRTRLCFDHTWYTGAVWIEKKDIEPAQKRLEKYNKLAKKDLTWYMNKWDMDNLESCKESCYNFILEAIESTQKTFHKPENSMLYFPPKK